MHRFVFASAFAVLLMGAGSAAAQAQGAASSGDEHPLLPPGEGRELMIRTCSPCHSPERAANERRNLADFEALMVEMQGNGLNAPDDDLEKIAQYLAKAFPPSLPPPAKPIP